MPLIENHPFSALSHQIDLLLWGSISLSLAISVASLLNLGRLSLLSAPILAFLTAISNGIFLFYTHRERLRSTAGANPDLDRDLLDRDAAAKLTVPARTESIALCWLLAALWVVVAGIIMAVETLLAVMGQFEGWQMLVGYVELPLVGMEAALLGVLAMKCAKQRRVSVIKPESINWGGMGAGA
jgi:hypothetical protein